MGNAKKSVVVYTANFGGKDKLLEPSNLTESIKRSVDFVSVTDSKQVNDSIYETRIIETEFEDVAKNARKVKILGFKGLMDYDIAIWHDSSIQLDASKIEELTRFASNHSLSTFKHGREDVYLEAIACIESGKDHPIRIAKQMKRFSSNGLKAHSGLYETGILVINTKLFLGSSLQQTWWNEIEHGSRRDQLSLPFAVLKSGEEVGVLTGSGHDNLYSKYIGHQYEHYLDKVENWYEKLNIVKKLAIRYIYKLRFNS